MLIFWKERLVVIANTKTGSTSLESALEGLAEVVVSRPAPLKHTTARAFRRHVAPWLTELAGGTAFETVGLVREPLDWLGSWYRDRAGAGELPEGMDFAGFGRDVLALPPPPHARLVSQAAMLCDDAGAPLVDRLFRYDEIDRFVAFLEDRLGCAIHLPRLNVSPEAQMDLAPATVARMEQAMAEDFALYASIGAR